MVTCRKACYTSKVLECCRQKGPNLYSKSLKYFLPNLQKFLFPLKLGICLHSHVPEFIELKNSLPKNPDLNSVNCSVWGHCNKLHGHKISVTDQLKHVLIECWAQLILNTLTQRSISCLKNWRQLWMQKLDNCLSRISSKFNVCVLMVVDILLYAEWKST